MTLHSLGRNSETRPSVRSHDLGDTPSAVVRARSCGTTGNQRTLRGEKMAANVNHREFAFRQMLINLDKLLTPRELSTMKFQCKAFRIGDRNRDKIESTLELFEKLEERSLLGVDNLEFLKKLLQSCTDNRLDVFNVVVQFEKYRHVDVIGQSDGQDGVDSVDLRREVQFLVDNLGKDWKFFFRALGLKESSLELCMETYPRNVREQMHMAFKEWKLDNSLRKEDILRALKEIRRNDLHYKLSQNEI